MIEIVRNFCQKFSALRLVIACLIFGLNHAADFFAILAGFSYFCSDKGVRHCDR